MAVGGICRLVGIRLKSHIKRDILVKKIYMENKHFSVLSIFQRQPFNLSYHQIYQ